jgi:glutamine synthetase
MQGRPVGKRVTAPFFFEHVLDHGIEVCDYLLACDVDISPLPGYTFASWESGYGDLRAVIDLTRSASCRGYRGACSYSATC